MTGEAPSIPFVDLGAQNARVLDDALARVRRVLEHGQCILGPEVREFESAVAAFLGVDHVIGVGNGTDALVLTMRALGIREGDEVILPSHTFLATAAAIRIVGAIPVFADVCADTMLLDPESVERCMTRFTRAIVTVHLNGHPCDMSAFETLAAQHDVVVIEDAAQSFGARRDGQATGSFGTGCFSLHPLKALSAAGDGGLVTTGDVNLAETLRQQRNLGLVNRDEAGCVSGNSRLDTLQAAILLAKLPHLSDWLDVRRAHARAYREGLRGLVTLPPDEPNAEPIYSPFVIRVESGRDELQKRLFERGIDTKVHYPIPVHRQRPYAEFARGPLPETERLVDSILSLPCSAELESPDRDRIIDSIQQELS